jgi:hypothetical protein
MKFVLLSFQFCLINQDEDVDIEDEVDLHDPVIAEEYELAGNALLCTHYVIPDRCNSRIFDKSCTANNTNCFIIPDIIANDIIEELDEKVVEDKPKDKILEIEFDGRRPTKSKSSTDSELESPRQPCSFFISTSPPLPSLGSTCISSEISSITGDDITVVQAITNEVPVKKNSTHSDSDEGVVLVMDEQQKNKEQPIIKTSTKPRSKPASRRSSTTSSNGSAKGSRHHSATRVHIQFYNVVISLGCVIK